MDNTVLIVGVAGFLGRYMARHFAANGARVIGVDIFPPENAPLSSLAEYHCMQLPDASLKDVLQKIQPTICVDCAGRASVGLSMTEPAADFHSNTVLTFELLEALRCIVPECKFLFLSSAAVYGNPQTLPVREDQSPAPLSPYGFHKWQSEILCREFAEIYGMRTASMRLFSAYGAGLRRQVIWDICQKALSQTSVKLQGTGQESRDFVHAMDIAKATFAIAENAPMRGEVYNVASGREVTVEELARIILHALDSKSQPEFDGVIPAGNPLHWLGDISKIKAVGFTPTVSLEQGIQTFAMWCRAELENQ